MSCTNATLRSAPPAFEAPYGAEPTPAGAKISRTATAAAEAPRPPPSVATVDPQVVARTHQIDALPTTQWDTTRCGGASTVAIAALSGPTYVARLAGVIERALRDRLAAFDADLASLAASAPSTNAERSVLFELSRHMASYGLTYRAAMGQLDIPQEAAVPEAPTPRPVRRVHWLRSRRRPMGPVVPMALRKKQIELAPAAVLLAAAKGAHREAALFQIVRDALIWEIEKTQAVVKELERSVPTRPEPLQALADLVVLVARTSERGVNVYYLEALLRAAGLATQLPKGGGGATFADSATLVRPGELLLLAGAAHMVAFGRDDQGVCYLYDSEGLFGDPRNPALRALGMRPDLSPASDVGRAYGKFVSLLRTSRHVPRLGAAAPPKAPWTRAA